MLRVALLTIAAILLCASVAQAENARRRVLPHDGTVLVGVVIDRTDDLLKLEDADGIVHSIPRNSIAEVQVLEDRRRDDAAENWADEFEEETSFSDLPDLYEDDLDRQRDDFDNQSPYAPDRDLAETGFALAVAPMLPTMAAGIALTGAGVGLRLPGLMAGGFSLTGFSVATAAGGSQMTQDFSGRPYSAGERLGVGLGVALAGITVFDLTSVFVVVLPSAGVPGVSAAVAGVLTGMALMIIGNATLASSASHARELAGFASSRHRPIPVPFASSDGEQTVFGVQGRW
jgi:hypothetical protein